MKPFLKLLALIGLVIPALHAADIEIPLQLDPFPQARLISSEQRDRKSVV